MSKIRRKSDSPTRELSGSAGKRLWIAKNRSIDQPLHFCRLADVKSAGRGSLLPQYVGEFIHKGEQVVVTGRALSPDEVLQMMNKAGHKTTKALYVKHTDEFDEQNEGKISDNYVKGSNFLCEQEDRSHDRFMRLAERFLEEKKK